MQLSATITAHRSIAGSDDVPAADEYDVLIVHEDHENANGVEAARYPRTVQVAVGEDPGEVIRAVAAEIRLSLEAAEHPLVGTHVNLDG